MGGAWDDAGVTAVLLDLFGTLVTYEERRTVQDSTAPHRLLLDHGLTLSYDDYVHAWDRSFATLEASAVESGVEFSMFDVLDHFADEHLPDDHGAPGAEVVDLQLAAWSSHVHPIDGVAGMFDDMRADGHQLVVVSNTHHEPMVLDLLGRFGLLAGLDAVVTSVGLGIRKPRPEIFSAALEAAGSSAADALFVGDSHGPDYLGPTAAGIDARLIVPSGEPPAGVPEAHVLRSVLDLPHHL